MSRLYFGLGTGRGKGGRVTSVDLSKRHMKTAQEKVTNLGLEVLFLRADVIDLRSIS